MLDTVLNMFTRNDSRRNAVLGLARIISRCDLVNLSYETGHREDRRAKGQHYASWGVWLFPCEAGGTATALRISSGVPAVTHDLRSEGLGIMTPVKLKAAHLIVAIPDDEDESWRFFRGEVRHNTRRPGGWHHLGIHVESTITLESPQRVAFREHIQGIEAESVK
jgi:hypothetical protein